MLQRVAQQADVFPTLVVGHGEQASPLLFDLKPYRDADPQFDVADFLPGTLERAMVDDRLWMLPVAWRLPLLTYNKNLLLQEGISLPTPEWTWNDVLAIADQVASATRAHDIRYGLLDPGSRPPHVEWNSSSPWERIVVSHDPESPD